MQRPFESLDARGWIIGLSVTAVIHLSLAAGVIWGGWLDTGVMGLAEKPREMLVLMDLREPQPPPAEQTEPDKFVLVPPQQKSPEPPKEKTELYSNANSQAANPDPGNEPKPELGGDTDILTGSFNSAPANFTNPPKAAAAKPSATPSQQPPVKVEAQPGAKRPAEAAPINPATLPAKNGLGALPKPISPADVLGDPMPLDPNATLAGEKRAPTLDEATQRQNAGTQSSRKPKQNGGVSKKGPPSVNVRLTGYGDYDARFVNEVRQAWLEYRDKPGWFHPGVVVIEFVLHSDGRITGLAVNKSTAKPLQKYYCQRALEVPAPFAKWTPAMKQEIGATYRRCRFSFHYLTR